MNNLEEIINKIITLMNIGEFRIEADSENRKINIFFEKDDIFLKRSIPQIINDLNHLIPLISKKIEAAPVYIDVNNYRCERERILIELAKAAARKVIMTKKEISLPPMNSYERRIIHVELSIRPDIKTESIGLGKGRYITIRPIEY